MLAISILALSIFLQLLAAVMAFRLIPVTGRRLFKEEGFTFS